MSLNEIVDPVESVIRRRRSLRVLGPLDLPAEKLPALADELTEAARLAPSAENKQPWRFVSVYNELQLSAVREALSPINQWAKECSMFIVVIASPVESVTGPSHAGKNGPINYYLYDTGIASAFLMLRATDFELIAHPIAGFDGFAVARAIGLDPASPTLQIVALIAIGPKVENEDALARLPEQLQNAERTRPERKPLEEIAFHNELNGGVQRPQAGGVTETGEKAEPETNFDRDLILVNDDGKIYHLDQATLLGMTSVDELPAAEQVPYGFIKELTNLGISVAAIPTLPEMNAAIFCYLLNLGSLKPPQEKGAAPARTKPVEESTAEPPSVKPVRRKRSNLPYTGA
jgi:nitroreductase